MKVDLPSGAWIEIRDELKAADLFKAQAALRVTIAGDGSTDVSAGVMTLMSTALLARITKAWSWDQPVPGQHSCADCTGSSARWHEHVRDYIGDTFSIGDWPVVQREIRPLLDQVMEAMQAPNPGTSSGSAASS